MRRQLSADQIALIDQQEAHYNEILDGLVATTRELDAANDPVPTVAQLTTVLLNFLTDRAKLSALAAAAIVRIARSGDGDRDA